MMNNEMKYEDVVKQMFASREALAAFLQTEIVEYEKMSNEQVKELIEDNVQIYSNDAQISEIQFLAKLPAGGHAMVSINVVFEKQSNQEERCIADGMMCCAEMMSSYSLENMEVSINNDISRVVSIWVCLEHDEKENTAVRSWEMTAQTKAFDGTPIATHHQWLPEVCIIHINVNEIVTSKAWLCILTVLVNEGLTNTEKEMILKNRVQMDPESDLLRNVSIADEMRENQS